MILASNPYVMVLIRMHCIPRLVPLVEIPRAQTNMHVRTRTHTDTLRPSHKGDLAPLYASVYTRMSGDPTSHLSLSLSVHVDSQSTLYVNHIASV